MKYDCGSSITFRVPGSITATNVAVVLVKIQKTEQKTTYGDYMRFA